METEKSPSNSYALAKYSKFSAFKVEYWQFLYISEGYNLIEINTFIKKGCLLYIICYDARMGTESNMNFQYSDYLAYGSSGIYALTKLNQSINTRFLINFIVKNQFYKSFINIVKEYPLERDYNLIIYSKNDSMFINNTIGFDSGKLFISNLY